MSLAKKLQHEIKAHPAKAGGLSLLLLVAGYFWAPLVKDWFGAADSTTPGPAPPAVATAPSGVVMANSAAPAAATAGATPAVAGTGVYDWRKYAKLIDGDTKMRAGVDAPNDRDPFARPGVAAETTLSAHEAEAALAAAKQITPEEAGLALGSTLIGAHKKIAQIGGKSYTIGSRIKVAKDELKATFEVVAIEPRRVVLKRNGQSYELKIPRPLMDGIVESTSGESPEEESADGENTQKVQRRTADGSSEQPPSAAGGVVN
jgi:hypothetical protein